jgi:hypothetical protein
MAGRRSRSLSVTVAGGSLGPVTTFDFGLDHCRALAGGYRLVNSDRTAALEQPTSSLTRSLTRIGSAAVGPGLGSSHGTSTMVRLGYCRDWPGVQATMLLLE